MMSRIRRLPPLFWIGLLPVVILLWVWADSMSHWTIWTKCRKWDAQDCVWVSESTLNFSHHRLDGMPPPSYEMFSETGGWGQLDRAPAPSVGKRGRIALWFTVPSDRTWTVREEIRGVDLGFSSIIWKRSVPFWLILAAYLPLWLGISWWQARRRRKKIERELPVAGG